MAKRSYLMSEVRGGGQEELPHVQGQGLQLRGATMYLRSGVAAESARLRQHRSSREELPPHPRPGAAARRSYLTPEARGSGQEEQPHVQGMVAARAQES